MITRNIGSDTRNISQKLAVLLATYETFCKVVDVIGELQPLTTWLELKNMYNQINADLTRITHYQEIDNINHEKQQGIRSGRLSQYARFYQNGPEEIIACVDLSSSTYISIRSLSSSNDSIAVEDASSSWTDDEVIEYITERPDAPAFGRSSS